MCFDIVANIEGNSFFNVAVLFGLIIFAGTFASKFAQMLHIPQVVGCIVIGIVLGNVFNVVTDDQILRFEPFTMFALGLIGFMIGGELKGDVFKKYGKQFFIILFSQGLAAFVLVSIFASMASMLIVEDAKTAVSIGLVFGAIASATAPAATVNVLWENKTRGPLTAAVLAIVALDDALALLLYRAASSVASIIMSGTENSSVLKTVGPLFVEISGAIVLGVGSAIVLFYLLKFVKAEDKILDFSLALLLLIVGFSIHFEFDPILPAMALGVTVANLLPRKRKSVFGLIEKFAPPAYVAFFVLAGAHMKFDLLSWPIVAVIVVFVFFRAMGKILGSYFGAKFAGSPKSVQNYLGLCLLPQAGVSIGLAILAGKQFNSDIGHKIIMVVMTATFAMEIIGPFLVKIGVRKAGEVGLNVTEEDLIKSYNVRDVMDAEPLTIAEEMSLPEILNVFSSTDNLYYPVINSELKIAGTITIPSIKEMFANQDVCAWLLAMDVCEEVADTTAQEKSLEEVFEHMTEYGLEHIPVVDKKSGGKLVGLLDYNKAMRKISAEVLNRRQQADSSLAI